MDGQPGFFAVLTHADVVHASRNPVLFSASEGGITLEDATPETLEMSRNMLVVMDPPRHVAYRRPIAPSFRAKVIAGLEGEVRAICRGIMGDARDAGPDLDFIHDVAAPLPTRVMGRLMGLPEADWPSVHRLAERLLSSQDPDVEGAGDQASLFEMATYAMGFIADRRADEPRPDLTTVLLDEEFDGKRMTDADIASLFVQLVGASIRPNWPSSAMTRISSRARWRRSSVGPIRFTTCAGRPPTTRPCTGCRSAGARRSPCTTPPPTATRRSSANPSGSTSTAAPIPTSPSASASTSAWAYTSPAWRPAFSSRSS